MALQKLGRTTLLDNRRCRVGVQNSRSQGVKSVLNVY